MADNETALDASLRYLAAGFSVLPIVPDGSKEPALASWEEYQKTHAAESDVRRWHQTPGRGVGIACGVGSGNLGVIDCEYTDFYEAFAELVERSAPGLLARLPKVRTPGKDASRGVHVYVRCDAPIAGGVCVRMNADEALKRTGDAKKTTAIEIRGAGNQVLAPGCPPACHPSGRLYEMMPGPAIEDTPTLTIEEFKPLKAAMRILDGVPESAIKEADRQPTTRAVGRKRPGDDYNERMDWGEILEGAGWTLSHRRGDVCYWTRPGKDTGVSATTGHCRNSASGDLLYVFSTNADPFRDGRAYSKFSAMALLDHNGDFGAAARELARQGYGDQLPVVAVEEEEIVVAEIIQEEPIASWPLFVLPGVLEDYAAELSRAMSCPMDFPAAAILTIAAAAIGGSRALEVRRTWKESGRVWLATVGSPGTGKSPALDQLMAPVEEMQNEIHEHWRACREAYVAEMLCYEADQKSYGKRRQDGNLKEGEVPPEKPHEPPYQHLYTDNVTTEALVPMLAENARGFLVALDELAGWINSMNQYKGGKGADRQFWLSAWNGKTVKVDRKSSREQGSLIAKRPFMCVLGGIQPEKLGSLSDPRGHDDGLVDRFLFVCPPKSAWPEQIGEPPTEGSEKAWVGALNSMWSWEMVQAADGTLDPALVQLSEGGRRVSDEWYAGHAREANDPTFPPHLYGPWSKLRAYYFRFCLVLHCLRVVCGDDCGADVDEDTALRAAMLTDYFKSHLRATHRLITQRADDQLAEKAIAWIRAHGGRARPKDLIAARITKKATEAEALLKDLADRGLGTITQPPPVRGKPSSITFETHSGGLQIHTPEGAAVSHENKTDSK